MTGGRNTSVPETMARVTTVARFERGLLAALSSLLPESAASRWLVAASGGADSTALLVALHALLHSGRLPHHLVACHVDHGLRPEAVRREEQRRLAITCAALGVPLVVRTVEVTRGAGGVRGSLEAAARVARYATLGAEAAAQQAGAVLTAHTAGDQVETVLLRSLRGTG